MATMLGVAMSLVSVLVKLVLPILGDLFHTEMKSHQRVGCHVVVTEKVFGIDIYESKK